LVVELLGGYLVNEASGAISTCLAPADDVAATIAVVVDAHAPSDLLEHSWGTQAVPQLP
jgi:hypothetical protein